MNKETLERSIPHSPCQHHEIIEPPRQETSIGTCIKCGATKVYNNFLHFTFDDHNSFGRESSLEQKYRVNGRFDARNTLDYDPDSEYFD